MANPNWPRYGLLESTSSPSQVLVDSAFNYQQVPSSNQEQQQTKQSNTTINDELFHAEEQKESKFSTSSMSWLKANFLLTDKRCLFGTWDGVFTSIVINVFGILIFLRAGWMVANAGILGSCFVIVISYFIAIISVSSGIALCKKSRLTSESNINGGIFHLISYALGVRTSVAINVFYCFGQAVGTSLTLTAFGESLCEILKFDSYLTSILSRVIASLLMLALLGVNLAGVKWIIRLQIILLIFIMASILDFIIGSFAHTDPSGGFIGYNGDNFQANLYSNYTKGENLFTVYGLFFPSMTGIFSAINMAADLKKPEKSIPIGTYTGITGCTLIYLAFIFIFGSVTLRTSLYTNYLIGEKISYFGSVFMTGLYICSISSSMGSFYGPSRLLQSMARQDFLPKIFDRLKNNHGSGKIPVEALVVITGITWLFILIGQINILAPIVCMPFMLIYGIVNYANFALEIADKRNSHTQIKDTSLNVSLSPQKCKDQSYGSLEGSKSDLLARKPSTTNSEECLNDYSWSFSNKWLSLLAALGSLVSMVVINFYYALISFAVCMLFYLNLRIYRPGLPKGVANLDLWKNFSSFIKNLIERVKCSSGGNDLMPEKPKPKIQQIIMPHMQTSTINNLQESLITETNEDYSSRKPYHHFNQDKLYDG